jgi:pimeloyl-ACP methyl ester carboxylesterase
MLFTGGPGANIFDLAPKERSSFVAAILTERDIVLMSERGTYGAEPMLDCPELSVLDENFGVWGEQRRALELQAYTECKERLVVEGVDLASFNNPERAADVPYVMEVLGYDAYNLWGVSGGGLLAQVVVRDHPDSGVRTIMTDSGAFPRPDMRELFTALLPNQSDRYRLLFDSCATDPECNENFPNLAQVFFGLVAGMDADPVSVTIKHPKTGETVDIEMTSDVFLPVLTNSFSYLGPGLAPKMIYDAVEGNFDLISLLLPEAFSGDNGIGTADGLYMATVCPEIGELTMDDIATEDAFPELVSTTLPTVQMFLDVCSVWNLPILPLGEIVRSDVPALLMEGAFDTNKPPGLADEVAANFETAYAVTFGDRAHVVLGECALSMMVEFMNDTTHRPDTSCVADRPSFSGPAGPAWWIVYNNLPWFAAGIVVVLVAIVGAVIWWIRRRRRTRVQLQVEG